MAGMSAKFAGAEKISDKYIETGSSNFSPNLNGKDGAVGVMNASKSLKKLVNSFLIKSRTFIAVL